MNNVVEFFVVDQTFPSGHTSFGIDRLYKELEEKFPRCYIRNCSGELSFRKLLCDKLCDSTVSEIVSLSREETTIAGYWMRYYRLRFVPVAGHWLMY